MKKNFNIMNTKKFNRKQLRAALALLCIVSGSLAAMSFKGKPSESKAKAGTVYYWYEVSYDNPGTYPTGYIKDSTDFVTQDVKDDVISPCPSGTSVDCVRGFTNQLTSFPDGGTPYDDQIKRSND